MRMSLFSLALGLHLALAIEHVQLLQSNVTTNLALLHVIDHCFSWVLQLQTLMSLL